MHSSRLAVRKALLAFSLPVFVSLVSPDEAHAKTPISIDVNYAEPTSVGNETVGYGGQLRFGPRLDLKVLTLDTELALGMHFFDGQSSPDVFQGMIGPRLGVLWGVRPSIFAHLGVGHVLLEELSDRTGLGGDVGLALDLTFLPVIDVGAHTSWNYVVGNENWDGYSFWTIGAHITIVGKNKNKDDDDDEQEED